MPEPCVVWRILSGGEYSSCLLDFFGRSLFLFQDLILISDVARLYAHDCILLAILDCLLILTALVVLSCSTCNHDILFIRCFLKSPLVVSPHVVQTFLDPFDGLRVALCVAILQADTIPELWTLPVWHLMEDPLVWIPRAVAQLVHVPSVKWPEPVSPRNTIAVLIKARVA